MDVVNCLFVLVMVLCCMSTSSLQSGKVIANPDSRYLGSYERLLTRTLKETNAQALAHGSSVILSQRVSEQRLNAAFADVIAR